MNMLIRWFVNALSLYILVGSILLSLVSTVLFSLIS
ncbi:MAG: hypothetical protein UV63_C0002G0026 [Microgenomates group bacterium GW2011_GWC1_43_11]|nr:MAG: hypothetical protein UV63_C0002G0026 [Microgenomates group bacterium GW2011_GWC1_43_11]